MMARIRYGARSEEQLRNREVEATSVDVWATTLVATYLTDPDVIAAVLPPPIEPGSEPQVKVTIATVDISGYPTFGAGSFSVRARHEGTDGYYALLMPMTTEQSVIGGRETFGEPKKLGQVTLERDGDRVTGRISRMGVDIGTVTARVAGVAVVTGGAGGIGRAMGERFARAGMRVVLADVEQGALDEAVSALRSQSLEVTGVVTDVARYESVEALRDRTLEQYGGVNLV